MKDDTMYRVSYPVALKLQEKGFPFLEYETDPKYIYMDGNLMLNIDSYEYQDNHNVSKWVYCPTFDMVVDWLMSRDIFIEIELCETKGHFAFSAKNMITRNALTYTCGNGFHNTFNHALEDAIDFA